MCACKDLTTCHRLTAVERLATDLGEAVTHLFPQKHKSTPETQGSLLEGMTRLQALPPARRQAERLLQERLLQERLLQERLL